MQDDLGLTVSLRSSLLFGLPNVHLPIALGATACILLIAVIYGLRRFLDYRHEASAIKKVDQLRSELALVKALFAQADDWAKTRASCELNCAILAEAEASSWLVTYKRFQKAEEQADEGLRAISLARKELLGKYIVPVTRLHSK